MKRGIECRKCGLDDWRQRRDRRSDGSLHGGFRCVSCRRQTGSRWTRANTDRTRVYAARWRGRRPEVNAAIRERADARGYYAQYRAESAESRKEWRRQNRNTLTAQNARRRAKKLNAGGSGISRAERALLMTESLGLCAYCNERRPLAVDHIDALTRGGEHDPRNAAATCDRCNSSKNDALLVIWLARLAQRRAFAATLQSINP